MPIGLRSILPRLKSAGARPAMPRRAISRANAVALGSFSRDAPVGRVPALSAACLRVTAHFRYLMRGRLQGLSCAACRALSIVLHAFAPQRHAAPLCL